MFKKQEIKKLSFVLLLLIVVIFISTASSAALLLNMEFFRNGILNEQQDKYEPVGDDIAHQITIAESMFGALLTDENMNDILTMNHFNAVAVEELYEDVDFDTLLSDPLARSMFARSTIYTSNPTISANERFEPITPAIESEAWFDRIVNARRGQTIFIIDSEIVVLSRLEPENNPDEYIAIGMVTLDHSILDDISLENHRVLVINVTLETVASINGDKTLDKIDAVYLELTEPSYLDDEMILMYDIVPGTSLSKWTMLIVSDPVNFFGEFLQYAAIIFASLSAIVFIVFYRFNFLREVNRSFARMSPDDIQAIIASSNPSKIERIIKNLYENVETLVQRNQELDFINKQKEAQKNEAEIKALLSQINPHYIFNLLNSIHKRSLKNNELESARMILLMSRQLRRSLEWKDPFVTIRDEFDNIRSYIELQQYYYGTNCDFNYDINEDLFDIQIPKLIFQTLIENALKHGVKQAPFYIQLKDKDDFVNFSVTNEVSGKPKDVENAIVERLYTAGEHGGEGIGLRNMIKRLDFYYNDSYKIITHKYKHNISITLILPKEL